MKIEGERGEGVKKREEEKRRRLNTELHEGAEEVGVISGQEGVGEEAAEEGEEEGGAHKVGDGVRRVRRLEVHELHHVHHQVARVRQKGQILQHLHNCMHPRTPILVENLIFSNRNGEKEDALAAKYFLRPVLFLEGDKSKESDKGKIRNSFHKIDKQETPSNFFSFSLSLISPPSFMFSDKNKRKPISNLVLCDLFCG